jgi:hypothetical protein
VHVRGRAGHVVHARQGKDLRRLVTTTPGSGPSHPHRSVRPWRSMHETRRTISSRTHHQYIAHTQPSFIASKPFLAISSEQHACNCKAWKLLAFFLLLHFGIATYYMWSSIHGRESESPECCCLVAWRDLVTAAAQHIRRI